MFDSARAKIGRAKDHLNYLQGEFRRFTDTNPYELRQELNAEGSHKGLVFYPSRPVPIHWSIVLGELAYNLRSALDHVIYDLSGGLRMTEFPIFTDERLFCETKRKTGEPTERSGLFKIRGIENPKTRQVIEAEQPFVVRKEPGYDAATFLIKELCNIDKHRTLHLCRCDAEGGHIELQPGVNDAWVMPHGKLDKGTVIVSWPVAGNPEVQVQGNFTFYIAFDEGELPTIANERVDAVCGFLIRTTEVIVDRIEASLV